MTTHIIELLKRLSAEPTEENVTELVTIIGDAMLTDDMGEDDTIDIFAPLTTLARITLNKDEEYHGAAELILSSVYMGFLAGILHERELHEQALR